MSAARDDLGEAVIRYSRGRYMTDAYPEQRTAASFDEFAQAMLSDRAPAKGLIYVCAPLTKNGDGQHHRCRDGAEDRRFMPFDLDGSTLESFSEVCMFMTGFRGVGYTTASHTNENPRARFVLELSRPVSRDDGIRLGAAIQRTIEARVAAVKFDPSVYRGEQPVFTPLHSAETMHYDGDPVDVDAILRDAPPSDERPGLKERVEEIARKDSVVRALADKGMVKRNHGDGKLSITCPFEGKHTEPGGESSTVYLLPHFNGVATGRFKCLHKHCKGREQGEFLAAIGSAAKHGPGHEDGEPIPFDEVDTPEIPARLLAENLAEFAAALAIATETPEALSVMMVIGVVAAAISKKFVVSPKAGWSEPVNLYVLEALPPGNLKSKVFNACTEPLTDWERREAMILEPEIKRQRSERKTQEKIIEAMRARAAKAKDRAEQKRLIGEIAALDAELIEPQVLPQLFATNCTPESLENNCHGQGGRFAVISDEGGALETLSGLYTSGRANIDILLKGIDGGPVRVRRKERNFDLNPYLTLALMAQPIVIQRLGENRAFVGYGALERWLYVLPKSRLGYRTHNGTSLPDQFQSAYNESIQTLLDIEVGDAPRVLTLTSEAREEFFAFLCAIEPELRPGGKLSVCQGWGGKLGGYVLRIAAGQHVVAHRMESAIGKKTLDRALELGALLIDHAIAAFGLMGVDEAVMDAREVWQWILSQGQAQITNGALSYGLRHRPYGRGEQLRQALGVLIERNLITEAESVGGTKTKFYRVHPKFAGRRA